MALPAPAAPSPQVVANAFVEQYFHVLCKAPEFVYRFYQDSSTLSRENSDGVMTTVTTTQAINDLVMTLNYKNCNAEILAVDSQPSHKEGVFILVTGCLTGQDGMQRKFSQSFFLAPQENGGFFVMNDVFRFVDESQRGEPAEMLVNGTDDAPAVPLTPEQVASVHDLHSTGPGSPVSVELPENGESGCNQSENAEVKVIVHHQSITTDRQQVHPSNTDIQPVTEVATAASQDAPKKSYAMIVKVPKESIPTKAKIVPSTKTNPSPVNPEKSLNVPTVKTTTAPRNLEKSRVSDMPAPAPEIPAASSNSQSQNSNSHGEEGPHSIYIRNLPLTATPTQVEEVFKKFGSIKPHGVQVRSNKSERFCFGFVEFVSTSSVQAAIEASPVMVGGRQTYIQEKRSPIKVVNGVINGIGGGGRGERYPIGRRDGGGFQNENVRNDNFRNDNFRGGRSGFGGNRGGTVRNDFRNNRSSGDYSSRGRGAPAGRLNGNYQPRIVQNGYKPTVNQATVAVA